MKESRNIIVVLTLILIVLLIILPFCNGELFNFISNLICGVIVGLVTSICQYATSKRKIVDRVYALYFDFYSTYYYTKKRKILRHYETRALFNKMAELSSKLNENLDEYHALFKKKDFIYMRINPSMNLWDGCKTKNVIKAKYKFFNDKYFEDTIEPLMKKVQEILICINAERFKKDDYELIKTFDYIDN